MAIVPKASQSLKVRITLFSLGIALASLWALSLLATQILRKDMERLLGDQQLATASMVAAQISRELEVRLEILQKVAKLSAPYLQKGPDAMQAFLEQRLDLQTLFNGSHFATDTDGIRIAYVPFSPERIGVNLMDRDYIVNALVDGRTSIGRPVIGRTFKSPVVVMGTPIRDASGRVLGVLSGVIELTDPSFLDQIPESRYGRMGGYVLISRQHRLIVMAAENGPSLSALPDPGENPEMDRYIDGREGSAIYVDARGVELLSSARGVPAADWAVVAVLPTSEAFAPIREMQHYMLLATIILTLLAGALTWWMLRRQFAPLLSTVKSLADQTADNQPLVPLPILCHDEIGELVVGFNRVLEALGKREKALKEGEYYQRALLDGFPFSVWLKDGNGRFLAGNQTLATAYGLPSVQPMIGKTDFDISPSNLAEAYRADELAVMQSGTSRHLRESVEAGGRRFWVETYKSPVLVDGQVIGTVGYWRDISDRIEYEDRLEKLAHYDLLTTLPNRVLLADRLRHAISHSHRHQKKLAVAYLDLDGFKAVNDHHGHEAGDQLLLALAERMKHSLREDDTLARLGGDEFVAVLSDLGSVAECIPMLGRLLAAAAQPVLIGDLSLQVSASLGVSFYPQTEPVEADQLLRQADQAMYQAKLAGKNRYHIFDAERDRSVRGHHASLESIRGALEAREFVLHYQPKVNMRTGQLIGVEALIRWQHPERGLLPPSAFLPTIESHPLSVDVGEWVIESALTQIERWRAVGLDSPVSVNVGAHQLQQIHFVGRLRSILAAHPAIRPGDLEIEVLETTALEDLARVSAIIEECRSLGVGFSLDDFGTGYSSLTYLKHLSVGQLKIDQSFVRNMLDDPDDLSILGGVLSLATAFHRQVIAEGMETTEHGTMLLRLGCELAQGYGISRPMPADDLPAWARAWRPDAEWRNMPAVNHDDYPLLFAIVEHRAWIVAVEEFLKGERESLPLVHHQCRFDTWLEREGLAHHHWASSFQAIGLLHQQAHAFARELCELKAQRRNAEALDRLGDLHDLRDRLLEQFNALIKGIR